MAFVITTIAVSFNIFFYPPPNHMDWFLYFIPNFTFSRLIFFMSYKCGYENCLTSFFDIPGEMVACIIVLYLSFLVYLLLALYLYQVVP